MESLQYPPYLPLSVSSRCYGRGAAYIRCSLRRDQRTHRLPIFHTNKPLSNKTAIRVHSHPFASVQQCWPLEVRPQRWRSPVVELGRGGTDTSPPKGGYVPCLGFYGPPSSTRRLGRNKPSRPARSVPACLCFLSFGVLLSARPR